jgi:hypothetical protein
MPSHQTNCESVRDRRYPCTCGSRRYSDEEADANVTFYQPVMGDWSSNEFVHQKWVARAAAAKSTGERSNLPPHLKDRTT